MPQSPRVRAQRAITAAVPVPSCPFLLSLLPVLPLVLGVASGAANAQADAVEQVVIVANRAPQAVSTVLGDFSVLDRLQIERSGAASAAELLARLPGIEFTRNGGPGTSTSLFIRGGESRHTAVYIDGVRVDSQATGGAQWEQIPLEQIERIEVLRGPAAAVYGSDAVAGVVQLFTRRGQGPLRANASLTLGSQRTRQLQAGLSGAAAAFDYALSASHGRSEGEDARSAAALGHNPDRDGWKRSSLQARAGLRLDERQRVEASLLATRLESGYDDFVPGNDDVSAHRLRTGSLSWQARWSEAATTRVQLGRTHTTYETQPSYYRTETTLDNALLQHEQRLGAHRFSATLERRDDELHNPAGVYSAAFGGKRHQNALGLGWRADFGAHTLQAQLRRDEDSEFGGKSTGSLAWGWRFASQWRLSAAASNSFRVPTLYQRFSPYGNPDLVPESGRNLELGLRWSGAGSEASLGVWRNRMTQLISFGAAGPCGDPFGCYVNVGRAQLQGVTLSARTTLAGVSLHGSLDWHDPKNLDSGKRLPRRAAKLARLGAQTTLAGWTLGAELQASGRRFENAANTQVLGGYGLVGVTLSKPLAAGLVLDARLDNLGDKRYELARAYATAGRSGQISLRWTLP